MPMVLLSHNGTAGNLQQRRNLRLNGSELREG